MMDADGDGNLSSSAIGFYQVQDGEFAEVAVLGGDMMEEE